MIHPCCFVANIIPYRKGIFKTKVFPFVKLDPTVPVIGSLRGRPRKVGGFSPRARLRLECEPLCVFNLGNAVLLFTQRVRPHTGVKKEVPPHLWRYLFLVPVIGVEPIRYRYHWILSPARLPIPSHRRMNCLTSRQTHIVYHTFSQKSSLFFTLVHIFSKNMRIGAMRAWLLCIVNLPSCEQSWKSKLRPAAS